MAELDDVFVGRTLLERRMITREELVECIFDLAQERRNARGPARPLGVLLVQRGKLTQGELSMLLASRVRPPEGDGTGSQSIDLAVGDVLVAAGAATAPQVTECLRIQRATKKPGEPSRRIGEILVEKGHATAAAIERALAYLGKTIYSCRKCSVRYNVVGAVPEAVYACRECGSELTRGGDGQVAVQGSDAKLPAVRKAASRPPEAVPAWKMPSVPPDAQAHIDRAVKVFLKQKTQTKRAVLQEAERLQMEMSRYGLWVSFVEIVRRLGGVTWQQAETIRKTDFEAILKSEAWKQQSLPGYRVQSKIATGGFATIFAAQQVLGGRKVALKVLHADRARDGTSVARFKHEAALMMRFTHESIVKGFEYAEDGPLKYIALELVEGDSLDRHVTESHGLTPSRALAITKDVAEALRYMQLEGYIHRDVKPQNVLVDARGRGKLCDLGFAQPMKTGAMGASSTTVGTVTYMSPEQARGELDLKVGTDIYALGLTLYFMLAGQEAFPGNSSAEVMADRFAGGGAGLAFDRVRAPAPVVALVKRMLDPDRAVRFGTYPELIAAIQYVAEGADAS